MTLPAAPQRWNIDELTVARTQAIAGFGFTERQARFLVTVMLHSGVFVERQYCAFAGIVHGQKTHDFLERLSSRGLAKPIAVGPLHRGRVFHVQHKPLYAALGETDNRHRKPMSTGRMVERLMILDAVLDDRTFTWLATESDKRSYFMRKLGSDLPLKEYPRLTFGTPPAETVRLFPDKLPIGIQGDWHTHLLLYLVTRPDPMDFCVFLLRHAELLRSLHQWTIRVLFPQPFARGIPRFGHAAREVLATPINYETQPELLWYFRERQKRPHDRPPSEDQRFRTAALYYRAPRFRALYRAWEHQGDGVVYATPSGVLKDKLERREGRFEFLPLTRQYLHLASLVGVAEHVTVETPPGTTSRNPVVPRTVAKVTVRPKTGITVATT